MFKKLIILLKLVVVFKKLAIDLVYFIKTTEATRFINMYTHITYMYTCICVCAHNLYTMCNGCNRQYFFFHHIPEVLLITSVRRCIYVMKYNIYYIIYICDDMKHYFRKRMWK